MEKRIVSAFFIWRLFLTLVVIAATFLIPTTGQFFPEVLWRRGLPQWVWAWANFDGVHYISIARSGYFFNQQPFFPLYPFAIQLANELVGFHRFLNGQIIAGQVVSSTAFILSLLLIVKLLKTDQKETLIPWIFTAIFLFPTAFFYTAVYNDALYLLFATLTILWVRQRRWILASAAGALATLTRLNGLALIFLILVEYVSVGWNLRRWREKIGEFFSWKTLTKSGVFLIPAAFFSYLFYVQRFFDTWRWVFTSMSVWQQDRVTFPLRVVWRYLKILFLDRSFSFMWWIALLEFGFVMLYGLLLVYGWKKIRVSYWIFFALSILIPMLTGTFQGMPRYGLHLYPMFLVLGMVLSRLPRPLAWSWYLVSFISQVVLLALFSRGYFVS